MFDMFRLLSREDTINKNIAKERLKIALVHDRADMSTRFLDSVKGDVLRVLEDYLETDERAVDIQLTRMDRAQGSGSMLVLNVPIRKMKKLGKNAT